MARAFRRKGGRFVAKLDDDERHIVAGLFAQTLELIAPEPREPTGDPFEDLVGRLGLPRMEDAHDAADDAPPEPRDPALERLLPSAHREDPQLAAEFRRLTEHGLREGKAANLATAISALLDAEDDTVSLDQGQAHAMAIALTDVRLLLGERLGLRTDEDAEAVQDLLEADPQDDPRYFLAASYDFMSWLQESLTEALLDT